MPAMQPLVKGQIRDKVRFAEGPAMLLFVLSKTAAAATCRQLDRQFHQPQGLALVGRLCHPSQICAAWFGIKSVTFCRRTQHPQSGGGVFVIVQKLLLQKIPKHLSCQRHKICAFVSEKHKTT